MDFSYLNKVEQRRAAEREQFALFDSSAPALNFTSSEAFSALVRGRRGGSAATWVSSTSRASRVAILTASEVSVPPSAFR
ncbi:hypothetical protein ABNG02_04460 [Halorubrum ejinorense]|uniref:Uncharacterized protein n=1 Tax=Halorubrum ejinorense TaxID=425309 RepID=A0ABV4IJ57_9EURY